MTTYYNEFDPNAAEWIRNLINAGLIAPGIVDERSIEDVRPDDLDGFTQCHFFAGLGGWSYALRLAGWADNRPAWTASCPCQPYSAAGEGGGFADERHLWPHFEHLLRNQKRRPAVVFGEQVASKFAEPWVDLVHADVEALGYAFGCIPFPSASVGAPHIRDRLYWMAYAADVGQHGWGSGVAPIARDAARFELERLRDVGGMAHPDMPSAARYGCDSGQGETSRGIRGGLADSCGLVRLADPDDGCRNASDVVGIHNTQHYAEPRCGVRAELPGPTNGFWRAADWLACRDGKWRPVEASPQPLVDGSAESLGRVCPEVIAQIEKEVNATTAQTEGGRAAAMRALLEDLGTQAKRCWPLRGIPGLHEAPFLLAFLRQLQAQGWHLAQGFTLPCAEKTNGELRGLRHDQEAAGSPRGRELVEQRPGEPADIVRVLSCILARYASSAWGDAHAAYAEIGSPIGHGSRGRVGRLRAYGNAINVEQARIFIQTAMSVLD